MQSAVSYSRLIALYVRGAMLSVRTFIDGVRDNSFVTSCRPTIEYKFLRVLFSERLGEGGKKKVGSKVFALIKYVRGIKYLFVVF